MNHIPLAERLRPKSIDDIVGQEHLTGPHGIIRKFIENKTLPSIIFWGEPGIGKTSLASIIATSMGMPMFTLSAINAGVKDVREVIEKAKQNGKALLFIDEIHRFNKSQQDSLLGAVEQGIITLIGATTENPSFEVIRPLLSRCQVYILNALSESDLLRIVEYAISHDEWLSQKNIQVIETSAMFKIAGGDGRKLLNVLELVCTAAESNNIEITDELVLRLSHQRIAQYDKNGEQHYDIISAFIKSLRGSDPNAAVYWMTRMLNAGEDPKFIARRMLVLASEDIGNANPNALLIATACFQAVEMIGYPECALNLSQTAIYLASSPKSNASYMAYKNARKLIQEYGDPSVPLHLRNPVTSFMQDIKYGEGYQYAHHFENNFVDLEFMPDSLKNVRLFEPGNNAREAELRKFLKDRWKDKYGY
ncbi:MAG: replication-associated recombination protein A [Bacteroidota bacterium]